MLPPSLPLWQLASSLGLGIAASYFLYSPPWSCLPRGIQICLVSSCCLKSRLVMFRCLVATSSTMLTYFYQENVEWVTNTVFKYLSPPLFLSLSLSLSVAVLASQSRPSPRMSDGWEGSRGDSTQTHKHTKTVHCISKATCTTVCSCKRRWTFIYLFRSEFKSGLTSFFLIFNDILSHKTNSEEISINKARQWHGRLQSGAELKLNASDSFGNNKQTRQLWSWQNYQDSG